MRNLPDDFTLEATHTVPGRAAVLIPADDLEVGRAGRRYLDALGLESVWSHQHAAVAAGLAGEDTCVATGTASGKTLVFHTLAIRELERDPQARVLALYPTKALAAEQEQRWRDALVKAGLAAGVARIDGTVPVETRAKACRTARVIVATPDIVHAWMLPRLGSPGASPLTDVLRNLKLLVVDEVHAYAGVFGSNAAFLFRRLEHVVGILGGRYQVVAASATVAHPNELVANLVGRRARIVGPDEDGSPRHPLEILFVRHGDGGLHDSLSGLFLHLRDDGRRFIAFFDSRKSAELASAVLQRHHDEDADQNASPLGPFGHLEESDILPYRAGYEVEHRARIQQRLTQASLAGVLSTSALELGLDIPGLDVVVLVGAPASGTSLHQRIGRVGRHGPGQVIVVHTDSASDEIAFARPDSLLSRPLLESAIYLDSRRVQYIHAMCLARPDGEHDAACRLAGRKDAGIVAGASWPEGFADLCAKERAGEAPRDVRDLRRELANDQPALVFPLRDVERQFTVKLRHGHEREPMGSISFAQLMREAYPGAAYYYMGQPYRVVHVDRALRSVEVVRSRRYTTQPSPSHEHVYPQRETYRGVRAGELVAIECDLQIRRLIAGVRERRGPNVLSFSYPLDGVWSKQAFTREFFTTGIVLAHPALDAEGVDLEALSALVAEAFLLTVPIDRQDVDGGADRLKGDWCELAGGRRFLTLHDQTYGSLRLSGRLLEDGILERVLAIVEQLADRGSVTLGPEVRPVVGPTQAAARAMHSAARSGRVAFDPSADVAPTSRIRVLLPTSRATHAERPGQVFEVQRVFSQLDRGLMYRGVWVHAEGQRELANVSVDQVEPTPDGAKWGWYDPETDEVGVA